tara:strand:+ start:320 stop:586 length:267 start_codon:yes stop_codon:yes gene_type:complete
MKKSKKILLKWAATYGADEEDVRASMYNEDMMIEFAKYYHKQKLTLTDVSQQRELLEDYQHFIDWNEEHDRKASTSERIESFIASNCG